MRKEEAVEVIARAAVRCEEETGVPAEIIGGMCALESGWLKHAPGNNPFGIKYSPNRKTGKQLLVTREWLRPEDVPAWVRHRDGRAVLAEEGGPDERGRRLYRVKDFFAAYGSLEEAFLDFARLMKGRRYRKAVEAFKEHGDLRRAAKEIAEAGYATTNAAAYADRVVGVVDGALRQAIDEARGKGFDEGAVEEYLRRAARTKKGKEVWKEWLETS